jgi:cob(I)alamin adenosyltransferase
MSIYTRKGDGGKTSDLSGRELSKNSAAIHFIGTLDELNCGLGLIKAMISNKDSDQSENEFLEKIQKNLITIMSHVSDAKNSNFFLSDNETAILEKEIDKLSANLPKQTKLVVPGKSIIEAQIQISRAVARRTERLFFTANEEQQLRPETGAYLNRLSDYLFVLSQQEFTTNHTNF